MLRPDISCVSVVFLRVSCPCQFKQTAVMICVTGALYLNLGVVNTQGCELRNIFPSAQLLMLTVNLPVHSLAIALFPWNRPESDILPSLSPQPTNSVALVRPSDKLVHLRYIETWRSVMILMWLNLPNS
jgi:hypothetical protein